MLECVYIQEDYCKCVSSDEEVKMHVEFSFTLIVFFKKGVCVCVCASNPSSPDLRFIHPSGV